MKRTLIFLALLLCPVAARAQHDCNGVDFGNTVKLTDNSVPGFTPVTLTWDAALNGWSGSGAGIDYTLEVYDDENGEHYVVSWAIGNIKVTPLASEVISRPGRKPLTLRHKFPNWNAYALSSISIQ